MSYEPSSSPVAVATKKMATPTRRAVNYLKGTWQRVTKSPKKVHKFQISSPVPVRRRSGICIDRTQLNDVVDDDDLTIVPSNVSYGTSTISSEPSPAIQDSEWRHFVDTPMKSSPSSFLGPWSQSLYPTNREARTRSSSVATTPFSIIDSVHSAREVELDPKSYFTPPTSAIHQSKRSSFLRQREMPQGSSSSSQASVATPTPDIRPSARSLYRRASDSVLGKATAMDLDRLLEHTRKEDEPLPRAKVISANMSDKWSFLSVQGESNTNDLLEDDSSDLPPNKRRKVTPMYAPSRIIIQKNERHEERENRPDTPRAHPRYACAYTPDPTRRVLNTPHGPAVLMSPSPAVKA